VFFSLAYWFDYSIELYTVVCFDICCWGVVLELDLAGRLLSTLITFVSPTDFFRRFFSSKVKTSLDQNGENLDDLLLLDCSSVFLSFFGFFCGGKET